MPAHRTAWTPPDPAAGWPFARILVQSRRRERRGFLDDILKKRVVLVTGKGGVGRSTVTAALAHLGRQAGKRVLVTEIADQEADYSALARLFGREHLPGTAEVLLPAAGPGLPAISGSRLVAHTGQTQFLTSVLKVGMLARAALSSEALRRLLNAAPSFREMGVFYHLLSYLRAPHSGAQTGGSSFEHQLILIDMPATGHTLALTSLPDVLLRIVTRGPIPEALREGQRWLNEPENGAAVVVTLPETLPVTEALELCEGLRGTHMNIGGLVLNRVPVDPFTVEERVALTPWLEQTEVLGAESFHRTLDAARCVARLAEAHEAPIWSVPEHPLHGPPLVEAVARALAQPPGSGGQPT